VASKTITLKTQILDTFGPSPSTKWNSFRWTASGVGPGNGTWGMKSAACQATTSIQKALFRTLTHSSMSVGISCPASSIFKSQNKVHKHTLNVSYANSNKNLTDGRGFFYVYPSPTINEENQLLPSYSSNAAASVSYTSNAVSTITWSSL